MIFFLSIFPTVEETFSPDAFFFTKNHPHISRICATFRLVFLFIRQLPLILLVWLKKPWGNRCGTRFMETRVFFSGGGIEMYECSSLLRGRKGFWFYACVSVGVYLSPAYLKLTSTVGFSFVSLVFGLCHGITTELT